MLRSRIPIGIAFAGAILAATPSPQAQSPSPSPKPDDRLRLDVEGQVEKFLEQQAAAGLPRFETSIEVEGKTPQVMIERFFGGLDVDCAPAGVGAPTASELGAARPTPPPTADLLALAQLAVKAIKGRDKRADRYFLYSVRRGTGVTYQLRDARVPVTWLYAINGASFELLDSFPDRDSALSALRRRERGIQEPNPAASARTPVAWGQSPCRPRRP